MYSSLESRLDAQAAEISALKARLASFDNTPIDPIPVVVDDAEGSEAHVLRFYSDYDKGFVIRPFSPGAKENERSYVINFGLR